MKVLLRGRLGFFMSFNALFSVLFQKSIRSESFSLCSLLWLPVVWCYMVGSPFRWKGLIGSSSGKVFPKGTLLQYFLRMLKVCIRYVWKHHAASSLGTQTEAQLIQELSNLLLLMDKSVGQNHSSHSLIHFTNRAAHLKHLLGSKGKYFSSFLGRSGIKKPLCKCILR